MYAPGIDEIRCLDESNARYASTLPATALAFLFVTGLFGTRSGT